MILQRKPLLLGRCLGDGGAFLTAPSKSPLWILMKWCEIGNGGSCGLRALLRTAKCWKVRFIGGFGSVAPGRGNDEPRQKV